MGISTTGAIVTTLGVTAPLQSLASMLTEPPKPAHLPLEPLAGLVERVTFHSDESGFCVLRIKALGHRDLVTVIGTLPEVWAGEWLDKPAVALGLRLR